MKVFIMSCCLLVTAALFAQPNLSGKVIDETSGLGIPFAKVFLPDLETGVICDSTGIFELGRKLSGSLRMLVSSTGYESRLLTHDFSDGKPFDILLTPAHITLDQVIVSTAGMGLQRESVTNVRSARLSDMNKVPAQSLGEAMTNLPGVYRLSTGPGISKPVVRGLSGPRVVTYLNGLRLENQQWGPDHGMAVGSVGIGSVEVIKGPSSLLYGSDAMGGVIYFVDEPYTESGHTEGFVQSKFDYMSMGTTNNAGLKLNNKGIKLNVFGSASSQADYRLPNNSFVSNSRFSQYIGKGALGYNRKNWAMNLRYTFLQQRIGIPGETEDSIVTPFSFQTDVQNRNYSVPAQSIHNHFVSLENRFFFKRHRLSILLGNTNNHLTELEDDFTIPTFDAILNNTTYQFKWNYFISDHLELITGSQGMIRFNRNRPDATEFLIPDARSLDAGVYTLLDAKFKKWRAQLGARYDVRQLETKVTASKFQDLSKRFQSVNYSAGVARNGKYFTIRMNASSGFRAPNTSELLSNGVHEGALRYETGDVNLRSEQATQIDLSTAFHGEHFELIVNPFYNRISNYIFVQPIDSVVEKLPVYQYVQTGFAQLGGADVGIHYHPHFAHWLHLESTFSYISAEDQNKKPLPLIPQSRINSQLKFEPKMSGKFEITDIVVQHIHSFAQNRIGEFETRTAGYDLVNIGVNMALKLKIPVYFSTGVKNLLNSNCVDHLSRLKNIGLSLPGRNFYVSLTLKFDRVGKW